MGEREDLATLTVAEERSRITIVGTGKRVDVSVPSRAPIGEFLPFVVDLCGQREQRVPPPAWSLAFGGAAPLPPGVSLGQAGITDGQVLYLRDLTNDPRGEPVIEDFEEVVAEETQRQRRASLPLGVAVILFGLVWLSAAAVLALALHTGGAIEAAAVLVTTGLLLPATAWALQQRRATVPAAVRLMVTLTALPCMAAAGALLADALSRGHFAWAGAIAGANIGAVIAVAVVPDVILLTVELHLAVAALLTPLLIAMRVDLVQAAAGAVLVAVVLVGLSKSVAATLAAWSTPAPREGTPLTGEVTTLLYQTRRLLTLVLVGPVVTLSVALPVLALSGRPYAIALACLASVGLLVRTQQVGFTDEILLLGGAGSIGLFAVLSELAFRFWTGGQAAVALTVAGLLLVGIGVGISLVRSPGREEGAGEAFSIAKPPKRRSLSDVLGLLCTIAVGPLVLGVFGVLDVLASMGRVMFG